MTESSDTSDTPDKPQNYAGLRAELATLVDDFSPPHQRAWPRLEEHKYRWELRHWDHCEVDLDAVMALHQLGAC